MFAVEVGGRRARSAGPQDPGHDRVVDLVPAGADAALVLADELVVLDVIPLPARHLESVDVTAARGACLELDDVLARTRAVGRVTPRSGDVDGGLELVRHRPVWTHGGGGRRSGLAGLCLA